MTHILRLPFFTNGFGQADGPDPSQEISSLLPVLKSGEMLAAEDFILLPDRTVIVQTRRLVILVPDNELDEQGLSTQVWQMASRGALEVLFLSLPPEPETEAYLRCRLSGIAAMTRDDQVPVSLSVSPEKSWLEAVERVWQPGDLLVCFRNQTVNSRFIGRTSLGARLCEALGTPVYCMNSLQVGPSQRLLKLKSEWIAWTAFLLSLGAFAWIQLQISAAFAGGLWTLFMAISVLVEAGILWQINKYTQ